jgi:glycosyltransferase involved in cell wall biosynthesis
MISGRDIVYVSSIEWNFLWQGHQEIALRLAAAGNRVLYIENTGIRSPGLRDATRVAHRLRRWARALGSGGVREVAPNVFVMSPLVMPPFGGLLRRTANRRVFLPLVSRAARRLGMSDVLIWTYLPNDTTVDLVRLLGRGRSGALVYYCVADFSQLTPHVRRLERSERAVVEMSRAVFTNCEELAVKFSRWNRNVRVFPFGVNLDAFPFDAGGGDARPAGGDGRGSEEGRRGGPGGKSKVAGAALERVGSLPGPVVGYVGGLHKHFDFGLLKEMAEARPGWSWVCVGALQEAVERLNGVPNVHLLGQQPHEDLVYYLRLFDVCIVPYVNSAYTQTVVPTKINEYLAAGKPVVSTDLPPVVEFGREHGVVFTAPPRREEFLRAIEEALAEPRDAETLRRRREVAELGDWRTRLEAMSEMIERGGA